MNAASPWTPPLHFDIEPSSLAEWTTDTDAVVTQYLTLLDQLAAVTSAAGVALEVDIPFWFDTITSTYDGPARPLSELVIDRADRTIVMDYRDHASPPNGMLDLAESELLYGDSVSRDVVVAVETNCALNPVVTFCEEGRAVLEIELAIFEATQASVSAFQGFAVHDRVGFEALVP